MKEIWNELDKLESIGSTIEKTNILSNLITINKDAEEFLKLVFDDRIFDVSDRSFEIASNYLTSLEARYPDPGELMAKKTTSDNSNYTIDDIKKYLDELYIISGNDKINKLQQLMYYDKGFAKWITRLIKKDLRIGASLKIINKALIQANRTPIEKFKVQLCGRFKDVKDYNKGFPVIASIKYNGERAIIEKNRSVVTITSRQGENIDYIPELIEHFKTYKYDFMLDGEIVCNDFKELQKRIGRKIYNIQKLDGLHFRCFDALIGHNNMQLKNLKQLDRTIYINTLTRNEYLKIEEYKIIENQEQLEEFYNIALKDNHEGIVVKLINSIYEYDSRMNWFKIKPYLDSTLKIIGYSFGKGKNAQIISSLDIEDKSGFIKTKVGSGITDKNKDEIMTLYNEKKLIGSLIDVEYEKIQPELNGSKSLLFPRFLKFRYDLKEPDILDTRKKISLGNWF